MPADERRPRVAVVGAGIAGLTAALRLSQRGYDVTVYEERDVLGGNLSSRKCHGVYHDVYPHMFCDWYDNFWEIFETDLGLDRRAHFEARSGTKLLRKGNPDYLQLLNPTSLPAVWADLRSGVFPFPDMFLWGYATLDLATQRFERGRLLSEYSVTGFLHSRPYATERCAELLDLALMEVWSIHSDLTSASAYSDFLKRSMTFPHSTPFAWVLKGNLEENLIAPIQHELQKLGCKIKQGHGVKSVCPEGRGVVLDVDHDGRLESDYAILAVPPQALAKLVESGKRGLRIVDRLPRLSEVRRLRCEPIAVVDVYFKRRLPGIPVEHVGLFGSDCDLTFVDISQLWKDDPQMRGRTALVLAASDFYALPSEDPREDGHQMIRRLHDYLPVFAPGRCWGDPRSDICWEKSYPQTNLQNRLFINEVGSEEWRPCASYDALPNVFFAGDFCRSDVDMATVEAAVMTGLRAAQALWDREPRGDPIRIASSQAHSEAAFLAMKLALAPSAYWAKGWSTALDAVEQVANGEFSGLPSAASTLLSLPYAYASDWLRTASAFWDSVLFRRGH